MAEKGNSSANSSSAASSKGGVDWAALKPKSVVHEDSMSARMVSQRWAKMMALAGLRSPNENTQNAFKLAVYVYAVVNGTSREGNYAQKFQIADGTEIDADVIPKAIGKSEIRRFFRGDMENAYWALKQSGAVEDDERFVAKVGKWGVLPAQAFATADFLQNCHLFSPAESNAHEVARNFGLTRSAYSRGGTLEDVEKVRTDESLNAQGAGTGSTKVPGSNVF